MSHSPAGAPFQLSLLDGGAPFVDPDFTGLERRELGRGAWIDYLPGWVRGSDQVFRDLFERVNWERYQMHMYDRVVDQPRLSARIDLDGFHHWPILEAMARALQHRYDEELRSCWLNLYRNGQDSVAWHGDRHGRNRDRALVADISLGAARRLLLRPKGGGRSMRFDLGRGDLLVMGGTCQRTFEHSVPKVAHAEPRISVTFRPWDAY